MMWPLCVRSARAAAGPPPVLALLVAALALTELWAPATALLASGRRGQHRRLVGASPAETLSGVSQQRCQLVCQQVGAGCRSFNFHSVAGQCEVFAVTACDSSAYSVQPADGWTFYDVVTDLSAESNQTLWRQEACVRDGRCRDSCLRQLGQSCRHTDQCQPLVTGATNCSELVCRCSQTRWQYNETTCMRKTADLFTDGEYWVWKKIVNGMCATEFRVQSTGTVQVGVFEAYTHYTGRYVLKISQTHTNVYRYEHGASNQHLASISKNLATDIRYVPIQFSWCSGQLRLSKGVSQVPLFSWNDADPLQPAYLAVRSSANTDGHFRFDGNLVDPWFGDWSDGRIYSIPRDTWVLRRRHEQDFWVEFECRTTRDCFWNAREQDKWHDANIWQVVFGGWDNTASAVQHHPTGGSWHTYEHTSTPGILSATEFRHFRVHFSPPSISMYRGNETEPFIVHQIVQPFTINYDGPKMCCNEDNIEYKLAKYDRGWSYEGGFRWGENLVSA